MLQLEDRYQQAPTIVSRKIGEDVILVPIRRNMGDLESIFTLNETAALVWDAMDGHHNLRDIHERLLAKYKVSTAEAEQDLFELVSYLLEIEALVPV
jgi:hypothetical protein